MLLDDANWSVYMLGDCPGVDWSTNCLELPECVDDITSNPMPNRSFNGIVLIDDDEDTESQDR